MLVFFLQHPGAVLARDSITPLNDVRRYGRLPADDYVSKINRKLGLNSGECFEAVRGRGYRLDTDVRKVTQLDHEAAAELYRIAEMHFNEHTIVSMRRSLEESLKALEANPYGLPEANVTLAYQYINLSHTPYCAELPIDVMPKARLAAEKALRVKPNLGSAHGVLGLVSLIFDYDWTEAEAQLRKALELDPSDAASMLSYAHLLISTGRSAEGIETIDRAAKVDPTDKIVEASRGWLHALAGDLNQGLELAKKAAERFPELPPVELLLGFVYEFQGEKAAALDRYNRSLKQEHLPGPLSALGHLHGAMGHKSLALSFLKQIRDLPNTGSFKYVPAYCEALVYAGLGDEKNCLDALESAFEQRCDWLIHLNVEPRWDSVRSNARFKVLKHRVGLP